MTLLRISLAALLLVACDGAPAPDAGTPEVDASGGDAGAASTHLARRHLPERSRIAAGEAALYSFDGTPVPWVALENLWLVWGEPGLDEAAYWARFSERYGFVARDGEPPYGIERDGANGQIQCLACHTDRVAGQVVIGSGNGRLDLEALYDDLLALAELAPMFGVVVPPPPPIWDEAFAGRTGAPGATDAFGMAITLAAATVPSEGIERRYGFQQPPAWWQLAYKDRSYTDGAATGHNIRTMLAGTLPSGASLEEIEAMEPVVADLRQFLLSLEAPRWPFPAPDAAAVARGRTVYGERCASCHGADGGGPEAFPDRVVDVGTDPVRHQALGADEATWINLGWFGEPPFEDTSGYLAPPLVGVWATAPYLHNGSVPDLRALLVVAERPTRWRRVRGEDDYDGARVGVRFDEVGADDPLVYDTEVMGLSAAGHDFAGGLPNEDIDALLAFLTTL
ncbi:MAG: c-type cytochrome [Sandaracinaceae bacterium]